MAGETILSDVNGTTKRVYDKTIKKALPGRSWCQREIPFGEGKRVGESYRVPVLLRPPNGFTHIGSEGATSVLKQGRPMQIKQAEIVPFEFSLRENMTFVAMTRAKEEGEAAVASNVGEIMKAMKFSASNRLEALLLHGQRSKGVVESITDAGGGVGTIVLTASSWSSGLWWALNEGTTLDSWTGAVKNNGSGPIVVTGIVATERRLRVTYSGANLAGEVTAADTLEFEGAYNGTTYLEMPGLIAQASNTTGTSLGLSATTYSNWAGNLFPINGNIGADQIEQMLGLIRDRGADGKLNVLLSSSSYASVMKEPKTQRVFDSSYSPDKAKIGHKSVELASPEFGEIRLVLHPMMKDSECLILDTEDVERVGSADLTFGIPGSQVDAPVWEKVTGTNYAEIIHWTDQAAILKAPNHAVVGTGITVS